MKKSPKKRKYFNQNVSSNERIKFMEYIYFRLLIFFRNVESWVPDLSAVVIISLIQYFCLGVIGNLLQLPMMFKFATTIMIVAIYLINTIIFSQKRVKVIESKFNNRKNINPRNETIKGWGILLLFVVSIILYAVSFEFNSSIDWSK